MTNLSFMSLLTNIEAQIPIPLISKSQPIIHPNPTSSPPTPIQPNPTPTQPLLTMTAPTENTRYNPLFTQSVIDAIGPAASPRMREVMPALIRHLHDFAREIDLTVDEWAAGVSLVNWAGQMSTDRRNEGQLLCDVLGLES